ncbi:nucleotide-binding protein [Bradyrhizobium sp. BRP22]|uniref:TIR domain-containing protein n=1 Tax=Bradyrhizobium sp. BRP22 TaxID=2793821 RepID=UPI001CD620F8|nr:nucleotide-binding protein [Bradyrhizobium sp. BRP22]MCA1456977.1 nucleotide-binding protein [Bradyrhizobium sp. BRP22]
MVDPYEYTDSILRRWGPGGTAYEGGPKLPEPGDPKKVFVSHGHDEKAKADVESFLENCGLKPIILADQPNAGRAILEKFEAYGDVGFAIVLLTADDLGRAKSGFDTDMRPRARQNVIMELGYFMAKLGRGRVCVLLQTGVEIPSNISGIVAIRYSDESKWQNDLRRELEHAGLKLQP